MKIENFKELVFEEDDRAVNPSAYFYQGTGNRKCQHITVSDPEQVNTLLKALGLSADTDDRVHLSVWWNLPRKEYGETNMWVTASGYTYCGQSPFHPNCFIVADDRVLEEDQIKVKNALDMLNSWDSVEVCYQNDIPSIG